MDKHDVWQQEKSRLLQLQDNQIFYLEIEHFLQNSQSYGLCLYVSDFFDDGDIPYHQFITPNILIFDDVEQIKERLFAYIHYYEVYFLFRSDLSPLDVYCQIQVKMNEASSFRSQIEHNHFNCDVIKTTVAKDLLYIDRGFSRPSD